MKFLRFLFAALFVIGSTQFIGCTEDADTDVNTEQEEPEDEETPDEPETPSISVDATDNTLSFGSISESQSLVVTTNQEVGTITFSDDATWCTIKAGDDNSQLTVSVSTNSSSSERTATITLTAGEGDNLVELLVSVIQYGFEVFDYAARNYDPNGHGDALVFDDMPTQTGAIATFSPSSKSTLYAPITVLTSSSNTAGTVPSSSQKNTRILSYMTDFTADYSPTSYKQSVNKYGSRTDKMGTATGRYHTEKIDGRWWIVDPEGYLNIQRGTTSVNYTKGNGNSGVWETLWSSVTNWLTDVYADFNELGFNSTGAFSSDCYSDLMALSLTSETPMTIAPSMGLAGGFKSYLGSYPNGDDDTECAVVLHEDWYDYLITKIPTTDIAVYEQNPHVLGFFSDNELKFCSNSMDVIDELLDIEDETNYARVAAIAFCEEKGYDYTNLTQTQKDDFAGLMAEKYYGGIRNALDVLGYKIMFLGSRLHGRPKQVQQVIEAAGKYCDVISINYYSRWSVEHTGTTEGDAIVTNYWEAADAPFMVSEFYVKGVDGAELSDSEVSNTDGAGWLVPTQADRGYWYQHFTLGLLESSHCVGWHWFRYQDDEEANRGFYDRNFKQWETLSNYAKAINFNTYNLIDYFEQN